MKIVFATDGSEYSNVALKKINKILSPGMEVLIISIYDSASIVNVLPMSHGVPEGSYEDVTYIAKNAAQKIVKEASDYLQKEHFDISITTKVSAGSAKKVILEEAKEFGAELIVVGSHGRGAVERFLLGSVSQALALHAPCSIMIVKGNTVKNT